VTTTPILSLRERVSPRVGLVQQITVAEGRPRVQFGGSLLTAIGDFALDYTIVHQPFQPFSPFRSAVNITARLQLGRYSTNLGTYVQPDGTVDYAASGSTFLYMGQLGGVQPQRVGSNGGIARYVVRGRVLDEAGQPVEGAAIDFDGETVFTNARGEFLLRLRQPRRLEPHVLLNEFLLPGRWRVNAVPERLQAQPEDRARPVEIRLERAVPIPALPDSIRPEPSDTLLPLVPPGGEAAKP
jgi:hypothetical protein